MAFFVGNIKIYAQNPIFCFFADMNDGKDPINVLNGDGLLSFTRIEEETALPFVVNGQFASLIPKLLEDRSQSCALIAIPAFIFRCSSEQVPWNPGSIHAVGNKAKKLSLIHI
eukprot:TRINITY_DN14048_c0_g1_i1.p2 TRINITY_DN14048_c0_g1~~TRINITY_DN14048_c0_g1_i1.p2  ORF type:complete len:113 (+),score=3.52 TRINITY_DN14048_c0_g1_i1:179-517(+)